MSAATGCFNLDSLHVAQAASVTNTDPQSGDALVAMQVDMMSPSAADGSAKVEICAGQSRAACTSNSILLCEDFENGVAEFTQCLASQNYSCSTPTANS